MKICLAFATAAALVLPGLVPFSAEETVHWPSFRGKLAQGVAEGSGAPVEWDVDSGRGVKWKTPIPGLGHSSPVIWGDRVFVTTAISESPDSPLKVGLYGDIAPVEEDSPHRWMVYCLDKETGRVVWERTAWEGIPRVKRHPKSTHANSTPTTDGQRVVAFFGSEGLYAYDFEGRLLWKKDLGLLDSGYFRAPSAQWGFASSPVLYEGRVIVQCDVLSTSFVAAFDARDGQELWRTRRQDLPTWSTPTVAEGEGSPQVVVNGYRQIAGYDLETGRELWRLQGGGDIPVPTPVVAHGLVFITNAHGGMAPIYAIRLKARGEISLSAGETSNRDVVWSRPRDGAYMQTPLVYGEYLYNCRDNGVLSCYRARTGERLYQERLGSGGGFSASPVAVDGKIYFTSEDGEVCVVRAGPRFELLAVNSQGGVCMATPAISQGTLYFRTRSHLLAVR